MYIEMTYLGTLLVELTAPPADSWIGGCCAPYTGFILKQDNSLFSTVSFIQNNMALHCLFDWCKLNHFKM